MRSTKNTVICIVIKISRRMILPSLVSIVTKFCETVPVSQRRLHCQLHFGIDIMAFYHVEQDGESPVLCAPPRGSVAASWPLGLARDLVPVDAFFLLDTRSPLFEKRIFLYVQHCHQGAPMNTVFFLDFFFFFFVSTLHRQVGGVCVSPQPLPFPPPLFFVFIVFGG